jgi:hypothetical protein
MTAVRRLAKWLDGGVMELGKGRGLNTTQNAGGR